MPNTEDINPEPRSSNIEPGPSSQSLSLIDYLQVIARRSWIILLFTLVGAVSGIVYSLLLPNIYTAKTLVLASQEDKGTMSALMGQLGGLATMAAGAGVSLGGPTIIDRYVTILKSEAVKDPIIDRFKLLQVYQNKYRTDTYTALDRRVTVSTGKKDGIITISVDDKDPKLAAEMANAYVEELGKLAIRLSVAGAGQNRTFLEERLTAARADLAKAEEEMKLFQEKNKAVHVTAQAEATIRGIATMRAQLAAQEVQLATFRRRFTESSQEVKNLATSVNNLRAQIARLEGDGGNSAIPSVGSVPSLAQEYLRRMREFKIQESLVEILTKQYEVARLSEARDISPIQVIQKAKVPELRSRPARTKMVITATFASFFFSVLMVFAFENVMRMPESTRTRWRGLFADLFFCRRFRTRGND